MIRAFFLDLDGTLLVGEGGNNYRIPPENIDALHQLVSTGVKVITASGRNYEFTENKLNEELGFNFDAIAANGAKIVCENKTIVCHACDKEKLYTIGEFLLGVDELWPFVETNDNMFYFLDPLAIKEEYPLKFFGRTALNKVSADGFLEVILNDDFPAPLKLCILTTGYEGTMKWNKRLNEEFGADMDISPSSKNFLEVVEKGSDKGNGVRRVCDYYGLSLNEVAVIGDGLNDISMLKITPHSFVLNHAKEEVKAYASRLVESVEEAIEIIIKQNEGENL